MEERLNPKLEGIRGPAEKIVQWRRNEEEKEG